ncbi:RNA polymerase sigma-70 factor [Pedobacter glucosidilyticus]|uniref:RNA polymerase sigma-70 factor n=1 Tax=Pedobacter glucosidilyticus TaxID=1122941 RepID=UPI0026EFEC26|nr:RNA polymerase sigma-70 factor [Pedobacter glucosidilyticus]
MSYDSLSDQELAFLLKEGDAVAFEFLYNRYWKKLYVVASRRLGDHVEAEELVQDVFLNLWRKREAFVLKTGFDNYFATAVKFEVINRRAKRAREELRNAEITDLKKNETTKLVELYDLEQLQKQLEETINTLPPKCQLVFRMSREEYLTNKKIAEQLSISEKAVEKHKTHALRVLKTRFGHYLSILLILS